MPDNLMVGIEELREALRVLLDAVEDRFGSEIALEADYYWDIPASVAFDHYHESPAAAIGAGQLSNDVAEMRGIFARRDDLVVWHDLGHVAAVLRGIAALDLAA
jgi:hypothetical protein